jgi:glycosyltransferase involved in cell wall biosynthesis
VRRAIGRWFRKPQFGGGAGHEDETGSDSEPVINVLFYSPANLNVMDGSAIWVQSVAETLNVDPRLRVTLPLKALERRGVITDLIRTLPRVDLVDSRDVIATADHVLTPQSAVDVLVELDRARNFDIALVRGFEVCRELIRRGALAGRVWACYVVEPERNLEDPEYRRDLAAIAEGSQQLLFQSPEMAAQMLSICPGVSDRVAFLPPAIPDRPRQRADPERIERRLFYVGKFHPFYPVERMIRTYRDLRERIHGLSFDIVGDKVYQSPENPAYARNMRRLLRTTPGVRWHGALPRDRVERLLSRGGVALNVWDYRFGSRLNDLVISTKLLDYASVGLPVVMMRTPAHESMLGAGYPLFVSDADELAPKLLAALTDSSLYRAAAEWTWQASRQFTYSRRYEALRPLFERAVRHESQPEATSPAKAGAEVAAPTGRG